MKAFESQFFTLSMVLLLQAPAMALQPRNCGRPPKGISSNGRSSAVSWQKPQRKGFVLIDTVSVLSSCEFLLEALNPLRSVRGDGESAARLTS
ncbi:hypothetical protein BDN72DRAFT_838225 [Pluteus cervinus]|uniref:Uncharacterized protein n=1 Tax=Pluteus cervinus TaxID=181527 RepID=A0ACD3AZ03_9AGAR|nr:hypothetical protein BDN72DRAFT_838225 [Pluteus cervinus]